MLNFLNNIGPTEIILIGVILIVFFGSRKVADLGKTAGEATKELKKVNKELTNAVEDAKSEPVMAEEKKE